MHFDSVQTREFTNTERRFQHQGAFYDLFKLLRSFLFFDDPVNIDHTAIPRNVGPFPVCMALDNPTRLARRIWLAFISSISRK
jgi:hypothetical protein